MIIRKSSYRYETPFKVPYEIVKTCTNITGTLQNGSVTSIINIIHIKPYNKLNTE